MNKSLTITCALHLVFIVVLSSVVISMTAIPSLAVTTTQGYLDVTLLNQDPDPAEPGKYVELRWKVDKIGSEQIENISFELPNQYPFSIDDADNAIKTIAVWSGYSDNDDEYYTLYYKVRVAEDAIDGIYPVKLIVSTKTYEQIQLTREYDIRVEHSAPTLTTGLIKTEPKKLLTDTQDNTLLVEILNVGEKQAKLVVATLELPEGFENSYSYSNIANLGNIAASGSRTANFYIDVDKGVSAGMYPARLQLSYTEDDATARIEKVIPVVLEVKHKPAFSIEAITYTPKEVTFGDKAELHIPIKNIATKKAESVSIRAFKESSQPFEFDEKSDYIGTLDMGATGSGIITLTIDPVGEAKTYLIDVEIRSIYNGEVYLQEETIPLTIVAKHESIIAKYWIALLIISAIIIIGIYLILTKKKNKK